LKSKINHDKEERDRILDLYKKYVEET